MIELLKSLGWVHHGIYSLISPSYKNTGIFIADIYNKHEISIYLNRSKIAQDGEFVCKICDIDKLKQFIELMQSL